MLRSSTLVLVSAAALFLSACASTPQGTAGAVVGGVVGGVAGSAIGAGTGQLVAVGVGAVAGAAAGQAIGEGMANQNQYQGQPVSYDPQQGGNIRTGQFAPPPYGSSATDLAQARPVIYGYPPRGASAGYRPGPAPVNGCQKLYAVSPYAPTGYACLGPNGTWYINE
ncbi:MAG: glycine zipper 2TM domain-containing protein [Pseudomonadota bacterium]|nr:glycine zipper 2TM domain-containing protein [Pseudomonadota bacterium]